MGFLGGSGLGVVIATYVNGDEMCINVCAGYCTEEVKPKDLEVFALSSKWCTELDWSLD